MAEREPDACFWRWRFQPVWAWFGHLGLDYTLEDPHDPAQPFLLRHIDYGLPGDATCPGYRQSIALHARMISPAGRDWPPIRTPCGRLFFVTRFRRAPRSVGTFLRDRAPRFWGPCGAYRLRGPNSNSGLAAAVALCEAQTGYRFARPPWYFRAGRLGWGRWTGLSPHEGPCPGYSLDPDRMPAEITIPDPRLEGAPVADSPVSRDDAARE